MRRSNPGNFYRRRENLFPGTRFSRTPGKARPVVITIGVLGYDGVTTLDFAGPVETFAAAKRACADGSQRCRYEIAILGLRARTFHTDSSLVVRASRTLPPEGTFDTVIVPGGTGLQEGETMNQIAAWLRENISSIRRVVAVCSGTFPLALAGFLDGRHVATHWRHAQELARRFPRLRVDYTASFVKDGPFFTCGGGTAAVEMALALIEEDCGARVALSVARDLVMRLRPPGSHNPLVAPTEYQCGPEDRLADLPAWIVNNLQDNLSVEVLAERACVSPRHFSRLFRRIFKSTPADFVEGVRLEEAIRRLSFPRHSVQEIANSVGFKNADSFRRAFERRLGMSPRRYRARLRSLQQPQEARA